MREEYRILSTTAILGYGFPEESFAEGMKRKPHLIAADAGSTDPGPYYLGAGVSFTDRDAVKRDLEIMLKAGVREGIPVVIGSAGGAGGAPHLEWNRQIVEEIAREQGLHFKLALIQSELPKELVREALAAGKVTPLEPAPPLTPRDVEDATRIVAQMGVEPFIEAYRGGAQVILAGRAYDPTVFASIAIHQGYDPGLAIHLSKILECAAICATPGSGSDCMFGYIGEDYFRLEPLSPQRRCTTLSVAAHTLYEKTNPYILPGPGGSLDLTGTQFHQESENTVRVSGSRFVPSERYTLKLEGAKKIGYRTVSIAGTRDAVMMEKIDEIIAGVRERVADNFQGKGMGEYFLHFHVYGRDGVMAGLEPLREKPASHEYGIVIEAVADSQEHADTVCAFARSTMLHFGYQGRRATAGNLAFPYSPSDFHAGEVYTFNVYHLLEVDDPAALFHIEYLTL